MEIDRPSDEFRDFKRAPKIKIPPGRDFKKAYFTVQDIIYDLEMSYAGLAGGLEKSKWYRKRAKKALEVIQDFRKRIDNALELGMPRSPVRIDTID